MPSTERTLLTYPTPGYTRLWIYVSLAILAYVFIRLSPKAWLLPADQHTGPWLFMILILILGVSILCTITEGLFLIGRRLNPTKLEFDADSFYFNERAIPLQEIIYIRLIYGMRLFDNARNPLYRYAIGFGDPNDPEQVKLTVFRKTRYAYADFLQLVQEKNPSIEITNWATSFDGLFRLFRGRKS